MQSCLEGEDTQTWTLHAGVKINFSQVLVWITTDAVPSGRRRHPNKDPSGH
jgi:hypothetical protein